MVKSPSSARAGVVWLIIDGYMRRSVYGFVHGNLNANNCRYDLRNHFSVITGLKLIASHSSDCVLIHVNVN